MPRLRKGQHPSYRLHKASGQAIVSLPRGDGTYLDVLLGPFGSDASRAEYDQVIAKWLANGRRSPVLKAAPPDLSVNELVLRFWDSHVLPYYRDPDGKPTSEVGCFRAALRPLLKLYRHTPAREFGASTLKAVRAELVAAGLARQVVNGHLSRVRRLFAWAVEEEILPETILYGLQAVKGLRRGRSEARETAPIGPVSEAAVAATLPFLKPIVRAMVELQLVTGMRPGEVCRVRGRDLDVTGAVWLYRPARHKTQHLGRDRVVPIGPKGQAVLKPFLSLDTQAYLFSPARSEEARNAERRSIKAPKPRRRRQGKGRAARVLGDHYDSRQYAQAIERACLKAFPPPGDLACLRVQGRCGWRWETPAEWQARVGDRWDQVVEWVEAHHWHPNQLRHTFATAVRRRFGLEATQTTLGHAQMNTSEIYAEKNLELAVKVAAEVG